ncbi:Mitochondrial mRNA pseudouridine synthase Trub2 [Sarcoptes scabiei]|uniref:Putative tRNA pseudouridine synthase 2 n=1 Tax=Sarcoptes scabiei TaxID=52283 RepID=A0A132AK40_SARSC|nr:Mitochondrial mRNA pseudouridine synthase Trub2 [Sarcoptes scabiei]KPM10935.1 tRNA pseudouridine synthase-like protein [Sarcoptes scabiei]
MGTIIREITYAPEAFRLLNGCFCIYKPSRKGFNNTLHNIKNNLSNELNSMECRPPRERVEIVGDLTNFENENLHVEIKTNLADHPLVSGERYSPKHISLKLINHPGWYSSGLMVGFIGSNINRGHRLRKLNLPKIFEIRGEFGLASLNYRDDGKVRGKATYKHIREVFFKRILSKIEANQRSLINKASKLEINSQEAYEIAKTGVVKGLSKETYPIVTAIQPTQFDLPNFTFKIQCYNDNEMFLAELVNEIGIGLKSMARCTGIRLIQYGPFKVENALLRKHWDLENIIENIYYCNQILDEFEQSLQDKQNRN